MDDIPDKIEEMQKSLKRIEAAVTGDPAMGHKGIVDRLGEAEREIAVIKAERAAEAAERRGAKWVIGAGVTLAGAAGGAVAWVVNTFGHGRAP